MRRFVLAIIISLTSLSSALAFDTPEALIKALYAPYSKPSDQFDWNSYDEAPLRSKALNALFAKDKAETPEGDIGRLDFDPYVDGQDYQLTKFKVAKPVITGGTATIDVTFRNLGVPEDLTFDLVKESDGWKVDDVVSHSKDNPYSLKAILSAPMPTDASGD